MMLPRKCETPRGGYVREYQNNYAARAIPHIRRSSVFFQEPGVLVGIIPAHRFLSDDDKGEFPGAAALVHLVHDLLLLLLGNKLVIDVFEGDFVFGEIGLCLPAPGTGA